MRVFCIFFNAHAMPQNGLYARFRGIRFAPRGYVP